MLQQLVTQRRLLDILFSMLDREPPLNLLLAGYFGRLLGCLLNRRTTELVEYLKTKPMVLEQFMLHLDVASIQEVVIRLILADDPEAAE